MFEHKTEAQAREEILNLVAEYCDRFHQKKPYEEGDRIPYASRVYDHQEMVNLVDSSLEFWLTSGRYTVEFEKKLAEYLHVRYAALVNSGSSANLIAFMTLTSPLLGERRVKRGDEVITVAAGFPTTVTPVIQYGAVPVFVDVTIPQYNIDVARLEEAYSEKTKAVMIAHTLGNPFDLAAVKAFCDRHGLWLVEDNCDALGTRYTMNGKEKFTGTIGDIGTSSFYPPHHMTMGEGGAILFNGDQYLEKAEILREKGTDRSKFFRGQVDKYRWMDYGSSYLPSELNAAYLYAQLEQHKKISDKRMQIYDFYNENLRFLAEEGKIQQPYVPEECTHNAHMYYIKVHDIQVRTRLLKYLREKDICSVFHYVPLHSAPAGKKFGRFSGEDVYTTKESERLMRLPMFYNLDMEDAKRVVDAIASFDGF